MWIGSVHYDSLCRSLAFLWGNEKATIKVRNEINYHLGGLGKKIIIKDNFLYPANYKTIAPKCNNTRQIDFVSMDELAEAMISITKVCIGPTGDTLCTETARAYGYNRSTSKITAVMNAVYSQLVNDGRIQEIDGKAIMKS